MKQLCVEFQSTVAEISINKRKGKRSKVTQAQRNGNFVHLKRVLSLPKVHTCTFGAYSCDVAIDCTADPSITWVPKIVKHKLPQAFHVLLDTPGRQGMLL